MVAHKAKIHPTGCMTPLLEGYRRFRREIFAEHKELFERLKDRQEPKVLMVTCSDSRIALDLLVAARPGELFVCRNAGNIIPAWATGGDGESATVEYAAVVLRVCAVVVCGHSDCGAMKALLHPEQVQVLPAVAAWLKQAEPAQRIVVEKYANLPEEGRLEALIRENVLTQLEHLRTHPSIAARLRRGDLELIGWVYNIGTGEIAALDPASQRFAALEPPLYAG